MKTHKNFRGSRGSGGSGLGVGQGGRERRIED